MLLSCDNSKEAKNYQKSSKNVGSSILFGGEGGNNSGFKDLASSSKVVGLVLGLQLSIGLGLRLGLGLGLGLGLRLGLGIVIFEHAFKADSEDEIEDIDMLSLKVEIGLRRNIG